MKAKLLRQVSLFSSLPDHEIRHLSENLRPIELEPGTILLKEGDRGDKFYILLEGQVEIIKAIGTEDVRLLGIREAGTFIGEMSLFNKEGLRSATVRAHTPLKMLEMSREEFDDLLHRQPLLAYDMVGVLSKRLNESENATIRDLHQKNLQLTQAYQDLKDAQVQLIEKEKLERELELARQIQMSILPSNPPDCAGYMFDACITPMEAVGGDFYDYFPLEGDRIGIAIGDVSDHGVPAALFMAMTVTLLRAEASRSDHPREILHRVNQQLLMSNDTNMFVTAIFGIIDCSTHVLRYARAGHELPVLVEFEGDIVPVPFENGMALGLMEDPIFDEQRITMKKRSTLLLYTDGLTDTIDSNRIPYGKERLHQALKEDCNLMPGDLCRKILSLLGIYRGEIPQSDDITMLSAQIRPENLNQ